MRCRYSTVRFRRDTRRTGSLGVATLIAICGSSCQKELPAGPDQITRGLVIYEHANYEGESALLSSSIRDLRDFKGPCAHDEGSGGATTYDWNDCISSIRVAPGWRAMVYTSTDFDGRSLTVTGDVPNLQLVPGDCDHDGMNDCITSISLLPGI